MQRLNKVHITMSDSSKRNLIKELGGALEENLIKDICSGKNGKFNGDNLDIRVNTNDIRMTNKDKHYHFFASNFVMDRVIPEICAVPEAPAEFTPNVDIDINNFFLSDTEVTVYKDSLKVLLGRVMAENIPAFEWFSKVIPGHIPHLYQEEMAKPSIIHPLPLSLNNECSYEGCLKILQEYTEWINKWYRKAGRASELEGLQVPVGGDQLTRVRFQGAKALRAGCHTIQERMEQLNPIIIELFHTLQDFLQKMCKKFLKLNQGRDVGTLANLKVEIQRTNVNGNVKNWFKVVIYSDGIFKFLHIRKIVLLCDKIIESPIQR
ncbi:uncharacterized protein LOC133179673 [Saccostrea echinata]|uniref:uncharacterized protein LOC133179673 n=1 Tax=Saccostrea echinata TaxID=191078 RepID=UPI002A816676|nr:uncharacterized protein LOC133179673 [Saccostrea echinata]